MKNIWKVVGGLTLALFLTGAVAHGGDVAIGQEAPQPADKVVPGMANKALRGGVNLVTGIVEWPMQTYKGYKDGVGFIENEAGSKTVGTLLGFLFRGPSHTVGRTFTGGKNLLGFWTANRPDNIDIGIPLDAYYAWEIGDKHSFFEPTLAEGLMPIPWKLVHGLVNNTLGIVELPGQIVQGAREDKVAIGVVEGVWFWWSRTYNGFGDVLLCLFPNPEKTVGYPWDAKWPWSALMGNTQQ